MTRRRSNAQIVSATSQMLLTHSADGICKPIGGSALPVTCTASGTVLAKFRQPLLPEEA